MTSDLDLTEAPEPEQTITQPAPDIDGCIVMINAEAVNFVFTVAALNLHRGALDSQVSVDWQDLAGGKGGGRGIPLRPLSPQGVNWRSNSSLDSLRRRLQDYYPTLQLPWKILVETVNDEVNRFYRRPLDIEAPDWVKQPVARLRLDPIIPESGVTIWFGPGDSGKGQIATFAMMALAYQMQIGPFKPTTPDIEGLPWYYIDYEDSKREWDARLTRAGAGLDLYVPPNLYRIPGRLPFPEMADRLYDQIGPNIGGLLIDSAMPATAGDVKEPEPVRQIFASMGRWNRSPIVMIAHETKAENDFYPYGNIFWHNLARATVNFRSALKSPLERHVLIRGRKRNNGRGFNDIGVGLTFSDDETVKDGAWTRLRSLRLSELVPELQDKRSLADRIEALLMGSPNITPKEIAESLDSKPDTVGAVLRRDNRFGTMELTRGGRGAQHHWHVIQGGRQD